MSLNNTSDNWRFGVVTISGTVLAAPEVSARGMRESWHGRVLMSPLTGARPSMTTPPAGRKHGTTLQPVRSRHRGAFTLVELLIVIVIIAVLAGVILPVYGNVQLAGKRTQSLNNMRQLAAAAITYAGDNSGSLPSQGSNKTPTWSYAATTGDANTWYNVLPRSYGNGKGLGDYNNNPPGFYASDSMFFVPAAKYPVNKLTTPNFAVAFNSKLETGTQTNWRLPLIQLPASTVLFIEEGVSGETALKGQSAYTNNQSCGYASRVVARYNGNTILAFVDGHVGSFPGSSIVDPSSGKAYYAQYPGTFPAGAATLYWEMEATQTPN